MSSNELSDYYFGPLSRKHCVWFYWLSVVGFVMLVLLLASSLYIALSQKMSKEVVMSIISSALVYGVFYFQNRLLYTMCIGR